VRERIESDVGTQLLAADSTTAPVCIVPKSFGDPHHPSRAPARDSDQGAPVRGVNRGLPGARDESAERLTAERRDGSLVIGEPEAPCPREIARMLDVHSNCDSEPGAAQRTQEAAHRGPRLAKIVEQQDSRSGFERHA